MARNPKSNGDNDDGSEEPQKKKRVAQAGVRHRREKEEVEIKPVAPPSPQELGTLTRWTEEVLSGGPRALMAAEHKAAKLAQKFGVEVEAQWCLTTAYLTQLRKNNPRAALYATQWRPRYLAVLSLSRSDIFACRAARISRMTPLRHRKDDPDFDQQCVAAELHAIELLHDVTMKSAIEGECEPVFWQGIEVGHIRKVDNRVRIEMLRAHMPKTFKMPGTKVAINTGTLIQGDAVIVDAQEQDRLIGLRREALQKIAQRKNLALPA